MGRTNGFTDGSLMVEKLLISSILFMGAATLALAFCGAWGPLPDESRLFTFGVDNAPTADPCGAVVECLRPRLASTIIIGSAVEGWGIGLNAGFE